MQHTAMQRTWTNHIYFQFENPEVHIKQLNKGEKKRSRLLYGFETVQVPASL